MSDTKQYGAFGSANITATGRVVWKGRYDTKAQPLNIVLISVRMWDGAKKNIHQGFYRAVLFGEMMDKHVETLEAGDVVSVSGLLYPVVEERDGEPRPVGEIRVGSVRANFAILYRKSWNKSGASTSVEAPDDSIDRLVQEAAPVEAPADSEPLDFGW